MPLAKIPEPAQGFSRQLIDRDYRIIVDSVRNYCGFRSVGSIAETLRQNEVEHRVKCSAAKATHEKLP